ncbi:DEAD/DEAH box helicase family protein [Aestuariispira ectoiniformans]|uniref:DEAD/DEAH box helicase family protein n=1 Tax=Aestuariispira ectoiniformans TaxID=2775080 RepID=UPI00223C1675|nr:DEAD/DEAH box helicase family protein [Aestuariispira ectoiniformans]
MGVSNFEFLGKDRPVLAELGSLAERYAHPDPVSSLVKLRTYGEKITAQIYWQLRLTKPEDQAFYRLLVESSFTDAVPTVICDKLHAIRKEGNKAAHGQSMDSKRALWIIEEAFEVGAWFAVRCLGFQPSDIPKFKPVQEEASDLAKLKADKEALEAKVAELEKRKQDYQAEPVTPEKKAKGQQVADALQFDEATTRQRLIDVALADAGWDIRNPQEVTVEEEVDGQPTPTGKGYADYVLWDDNGRPLAVVEAKRASQSEERGQKQAELYADALERLHGQRPVIFYTNGYNIWIWDDLQKYPPRRLFGFYSKASLQHLVNFQRSYKEDLKGLKVNAEIAGRMYQIETIKRVTDEFTKRHCKALIVQATGTGKTRVAIALTDLLIRAKWVKRVLFLCDRRELRKQAKNAFNDHMNEPLTIVSKRSIGDTKHRIFLATYPSMQQIFQSFDVGFFDLIIADESHRSIYNVYGDMFRYFDCLQVGLTATPVEFISRNTYQLFGRTNQDPTAFYPLEQAIKEKHLVPFEVFSHTTNFLREGIKYDQLTEDQKRQVEEEGLDPEGLNHEAGSVDKQIFNKDTNRLILRNLMENGIHNADGQEPGKTIIFARNHKHAVLLHKLFDEMYPQYGGKFCKVIDNHDPRAEALIDDFKGEGTNNDLTIAISVDMLDTGIDVPEVVNLVFAKPVRSRVKFWQMIGRGTRLCEDLFGPGQNKKIFRIFDHWGNFEHFGEDKPEAEPSQSKPLMQRLFEARLMLAEKSLNAAHVDDFKTIADLIETDVKSLPDDSISVKDRWRELLTVKAEGVIEHFAPETRQTLRNVIAPLMQWVNIRGYREAYEFDLLVAQTQLAALEKANDFENSKGEILNQINSLRMNLNPVREKAATIKRVKSPEFWQDVSLDDLEDIRSDLRSIMKYRESGGFGAGDDTVVYDIKEDVSGVQVRETSSNFLSIDLAAYRQRVEAALTELFDTDPTLQKIRTCEPVSEADLQRLVSLVLTQHPDLDLNLLREFYPKTANSLDLIIRSIVGMDEEAVQERFQVFAQHHPDLSAKQLRFLRLLQNHIAKNGSIQKDRLVDAPFTSVDADGVYGVFHDPSQIDELLGIIDSFQASPKQGNRPT